MLLQNNLYAANIFAVWCSITIMAGLLNLKGVVLAGLMQAQKLIRVIDDKSGIDPQFCIMTPEGDFWISMTLSDDLRERMNQLQLVSKFMACKMALAFTLSGELTNPDAVYCFGASHSERIAAVSTIERDPIRFGNPEWLSPEQVGEEILALLPQGEIALDATDLTELNTYFGLNGKFPALRLGNSGR